MPEESKEGRIKVEDLPQAERELTPEEATAVKGGVTAATQGRGVFTLSTDAIGPQADDGTKAGVEGLAINKAANAGQE